MALPSLHQSAAARTLEPWNLRLVELLSRQLDVSPGRFSQCVHGHPDALAGRRHGQPEPEAAAAFPTGKPRQPRGLPSCSFRRHRRRGSGSRGVIMGKYSPCTQGWPYRWMLTGSSWAETLSIAAVACSSGSRTTRRRCSAARNLAARWWARRRHRCASAACQPGAGPGNSRSRVLVTGSAPTAIRLSATVATISAVSSGPPPPRCPRLPSRCG